MRENANCAVCIHFAIVHFTKNEKSVDLNTPQNDAHLSHVDRESTTFFLLNIHWIDYTAIQHNENRRRKNNRILCYRFVPIVVYCCCYCCCCCLFRLPFFRNNENSWKESFIERKIKAAQIERTPSEQEWKREEIETENANKWNTNINPLKLHANDIIFNRQILSIECKLFAHLSSMNALQSLSFAAGYLSTDFIFHLFFLAWNSEKVIFSPFSLVVIRSIWCKSFPMAKNDDKNKTKVKRTLKRTTEWN